MAAEIITTILDKLFLLAAVVIGGLIFRAGYWMGNSVSYFKEHLTYPDKPGDTKYRPTIEPDSTKKDPSEEEWEAGL
jgi:hypothetical protein